MKNRIFRHSSPKSGVFLCSRNQKEVLPSPGRLCPHWPGSASVARRRYCARQSTYWLQQPEKIQNYRSAEIQNKKILKRQNTGKKKCRNPKSPGGAVPANPPTDSGSRHYLLFPTSHMGLSTFSGRGGGALTWDFEGNLMTRQKHPSEMAFFSLDFP